ncbi:MAG: AAA family ATPase [Chloroflexi bacterium]|nr:AAA family ATPase [Chloroflexota bacterium]
MKCPNCAHDNPAESKFCENCGNVLERTCPNCGKPVAWDAKFCRACGFNLVNTPPGRLTDLPQSAPKTLPEKDRAPSAPMAGERKLVTVLFTDIVGSTALAEQLDPEDWGEIVTGAHQRVSAAVYRYEGTIAQLLGDGVLAFFGAPITHEDDPERAVNAAVDILQRITEYETELRVASRKRVERFQMRVGLNTGLVVVGNIGSDMHVEYLAVGDTVNLAARMQSAADPGTILLAPNTARAVKHAFDLESPGAIQVKGKSEPVAAFRVRARKAVAESARGIAGLDAPLIGRDREMQLLHTRLAEVRAGHGHIVAIMGEAGLGKSRLMAEVRKLEVRNWKLEVGGNPTSNLQWLEGRSLSFETNTPYAPFIDLFHKAFDLHGDENIADAYTKIKTRAGDGAPFLATMLRIQPSDEDGERVRYLEPPQLRAAIFQAIGTWVEQTARATPLVLLFEDLHWADATSLDLIEQILPLTERVPLLLIAAFRPQRQEPSWRFHELASRDYAHRYTPITLEPLDENDSRALVASLLHIEDLPEKVRALILKKAEGNPFFVEEVIRSLLDAKLVVRDNGHWRATREIENIAIPDTLAGVIGARLDRLDETSKQTAQTAAVIGREFPFAILSNVADAPQSLDGALANLQRRELVREKSRAPDFVYLFKHALTQETAYASMLLSKRRALHHRVGDCLERLDKERVYDLARHFSEAQEPARALPYLIEAGSRAAREYSTPEAIGYFSRAVEIAHTQNDVPHARRAYEGLGNALLLIGDVPRTLQNHQAMLAFAEAHHDAPMQVSALNKLAMTQLLIGDFANVETNLRESEKIARAANDRAGLSELFTVRCGICTGTGDFDNAIKYLGESVAVGRELNVKEQMAFGMTHTANTLMFITNFDDAWQKAQEAMQICEEIGDRQHQAELLAGVYAFVHIRNGELDQAREYGQRGVAIGQRIGAAMALADGNYMLGTIARLRGEYENAIHHFEQSTNAGKIAFPGMDLLGLGALGSTWLDISPVFADKAIELHSQVLQMASNPMIASMCATAWTDMGFCALTVGNLDRATEMFQKGLNYPTTMGLMVKANLLLGSAYVALAREQFADAAQLIADAREYASARAMQHLYPEITLADARVSVARGDIPYALEQFTQATELARAMQMRPARLRAHLGAAHALDALKRVEEANAQRQAARALRDEIAALIRDDTLRAKYVEHASTQM